MNKVGNWLIVTIVNDGRLATGNCLLLTLMLLVVVCRQMQSSVGDERVASFNDVSHVLRPVYVVISYRSSLLKPGKQ